MDTLIERIKLAVADGASSEAKQSGADACRGILAALEAEPGQALAAPAAPRFNVLALDTTQILDLMIGGLRAAAAKKQGVADVDTPVASGLQIQLIPTLDQGQ